MRPDRLSDPPVGGGGLLCPDGFEQAFLVEELALATRLLDLRLQFAATLLCALSPRPFVDRPGSDRRVGGLLLSTAFTRPSLIWSLAELMDLAI